MFKSAAKRINGLEETSPASQNQGNSTTGNSPEEFFPEIDNGDRFTPVALRMITTEPAGAKPD